MNLEIRKKEFIPYYVTAGLLIVSLLVSILFYLINYPGKRRSFVFPSANEGTYVVEYRYLPNNPVQGDINLYVDEILLGSGIERTKFLFTPGTKVESCFLRNGVLYLNLTPELLKMGNGVIEIQEGIELLKTNIQKNFYKVRRIEVFVDGKYAYEYKHF